MIAATTHARVSHPKKKKPLFANAVFGTTLVVFTEVMFFGALISAYLVIKAGNAFWLPPENVTLPVVMTGINTGILLLSGILLFISGPKAASDQPKKNLVLFSAILGTTFVVIQGYEWVKLLGVGMTMTNDVFGALFFLLIGSHGLHAAAGCLVLFWASGKAISGKLKKDQLRATQIFWAFIVGVWPVLYGLVYF